MMTILIPGVMWRREREREGEESKERSISGEGLRGAELMTTTTTRALGSFRLQ